MLTMRDQAVILEDAISESDLESMLNFAKDSEPYKDALLKMTSGESFYKFIPLSANSIKKDLVSESLNDSIKRFHKVLCDILIEKTSLPILSEGYCGISVCINYSMNYHADAERPHCQADRDLGKPEEIGHGGFKNPSKNEWQPNHTPHWVYTSLIYLSDDFEGGETTLPVKDIDIKPKKRRLFGFPCSRDYIHGVRKNTGGIRVTFSSWYKLADSQAELKDLYGYKDAPCLS